MKTMKIKNVEIGDKFINTTHRKSKRISTVVDFIERKSFVSGKIIDYEVVSQHEFMGQTLTSYPSFTTVVRNRIKQS